MHQGQKIDPFLAVSPKSTKAEVSKWLKEFRGGKYAIAQDLLEVDGDELFTFSLEDLVDILKRQILAVGLYRALHPVDHAKEQEEENTPPIKKPGGFHFQELSPSLKPDTKSLPIEEKKIPAQNIGDVKVEKNRQNYEDEDSETLCSVATKRNIHYNRNSSGNSFDIHWGPKKIAECFWRALSGTKSNTPNELEKYFVSNNLSLHELSELDSDGKKDLLRNIANITQVHTEESLSPFLRIPPPFYPIWLVSAELFSRSKYDKTYTSDNFVCKEKSRQPYYSPTGWDRISFIQHSQLSETYDWHVAYIGTALNKETIKKYSTSENQMETLIRVIAKDNEVLINVSPSIEYAAYNSLNCPVKDGYVRCVLQARIKPESYIKEDSVKMDAILDKSVAFDNCFHNDNLVWSIYDPYGSGAMSISGIMLQTITIPPFEYVKNNFNENSKGRIINGNGKWLWNCQPPGGHVKSVKGPFTEYTPDINEQIEKAWKHCQRYVYIGKLGKYIDFSRMLQISCDDPNKVRRVKRQ